MNLTLRCLALHGLQCFRNERSDVMDVGVAVSKGLIEGKVRQRKTRQRRLQIVSSIDADGAFENINPMTAQAAAPGQK